MGMKLRTLIFIWSASASVLCQAVGVSPTFQNHGVCDPRVHGEAVCQSVSLLQTRTVSRAGKDLSHENNDDRDHDENNTMAIKGPASDSIALQLGGSPIPCKGQPGLQKMCTADRLSSSSAGSGWQKVYGHRIYASAAAYPQKCTSISGNKKMTGSRTYREGGTSLGRLIKEKDIPGCVTEGRVTLDQAKQICQSMSDCKAFTYSHLQSPMFSVGLVTYEGKGYFWSKGEPLEPLSWPSTPLSVKEGIVTYIKDNDDNMGPDLEIAGEALQHLKKFSESAKKQLGNAATKDDLKKVVHRLEEHFEEQMTEAGKHILENRKYIKRISHALESIVQSRSSRRRRRK